MRKLKYIYWAGTFVMSLFFSQGAMAQNDAANQTSPASIELTKAKSLWFNTKNGAGLTLDKLSNFNDLNIYYTVKNGAFKKTQDGSREGDICVSTEGGLKLGSGYVWGKFSYNNQLISNSQFNTTELNLDRGVPFYVADKNISDWVKQSYVLQMKASSKPFWDVLFLGVEADYKTMTGAKQIDPRSKVDSYTIDVRPSVAMKFNNHSFGVNAEYQNLSQEAIPSNSNNQQDQPVFILKGLGNFATGVVGGLQGIGTFLYSGNKLGGGVQYSYSYNKYKALISANYSYRVEDVNSSPSKPKKEGTIKEKNYNGKIQILRLSKDLQRLEVSFVQNEISGIEYVQVLDNSYTVQQWVTKYSSVRSKFNIKEMAAKYDFFRGSDKEYKWKAGISGAYSICADEYLMPKSNLDVNNFVFGGNVKGNFKVGKISKVIAGFDAKYNKNVKGEYNYNGAEPNSIIIKEFMNPDFLYRSQDYYKLGTEVLYICNVISKGNSGMFVKLACDYYKPTKGSDYRVVTSFGLGFTF